VKRAEGPQLSVKGTGPARYKNEISSRRRVFSSRKKGSRETNSTPLHCRKEKRKGGNAPVSICIGARKGKGGSRSHHRKPETYTLNRVQPEGNGAKPGKEKKGKRNYLVSKLLVASWTNRSDPRSEDAKKKIEPWTFFEAQESSMGSARRKRRKAELPKAYGHIIPGSRY